MGAHARRYSGVLWVLMLVWVGGAKAAAESPPSDVPPGVQGLFAALDDPNPQVVAGALEALHSRETVLFDGELRTRIRQQLREFSQGPRLKELLQATELSARLTAIKLVDWSGTATPEQVGLLVQILESPDTEARLAAAQVLVRLGQGTEPVVATLGKMLSDDSRVFDTEEAVRLLGEVGVAARSQQAVLVKLLDNGYYTAQIAAAEVLEQMGESAPARAALDRLLKDPKPEVQLAAARALGKMGDTARAEATLFRLVESPEFLIHMGAVEALLTLGDDAPAQPIIDKLLKSPSAYDQLKASIALLEAKRDTARALDTLDKLLKSTDPIGVQYDAAIALLKKGDPPRAQAALDTLLRRSDLRSQFDAAQELLRRGEKARALALFDKVLAGPESILQLFVVNDLVEMGETARVHALMKRYLDDPRSALLASAALMMENLGEATPGQASLLIPLLEHDNSAVRAAAAIALGSLAPGDRRALALVLAQVHHQPALRHEWLLYAHALGGGEPQVERLLRWVGRNSEDLPKSLSREEARPTLEALASLWSEARKYPNLRDELAERIAKVTDLASGHWERSELGLLRSLEKELLEEPATRVHAKPMEAAITHLQRWNLLKYVGWSWAAHAGFWVLLLFFYPYSARVQASLFWNPWFRRLLGLGYVNLLLTWVPPLRRRLLAPFRGILLAGAHLSSFSEETYFERCQVLPPGGEQPQPLLQALPALRGQVVLWGASGLGKSMFIKHLLRSSSRLAVYLPAERCKSGVIEAIHAMLQGHAGDDSFLRSLIYSGVLDIYIDGLNEVEASTRVLITQFVQSNPHGNILLATQPLELKTLPETAKVYELLPLAEEQIIDFLLSREPTLEDIGLRGPRYREACTRFVAKSLSHSQPQALYQAMKEVLSNPMDLTLVARMLAQERSPDLFHLQEQQYAWMAEEYRKRYGSFFPRDFAEEAYRMRLEDRADIPKEKFEKPLSLMEEEPFKMVVRREWTGLDEQGHGEWHFRHDKIQEFFIAQTFHPGVPRVEEHLGDARFRGVYLLLALHLDWRDARALRDQLVLYAARNGNHSISDDFVKLFKVREDAEAAQASVRPILPEGRFPPETRA